jgi:hypothetical protein
LKFFGTGAVLGIATMAATISVTPMLFTEVASSTTFRSLLGTLLLLSALKLLFEASFFGHLLDKQQGDLKRTALLMMGELRQLTTFRFIAGALGGIASPGALLLSKAQAGTAGAVSFSLLSLLLLLLGELLERLLFFMAVSAPRMPGSIGK